MGIFSSDHMKKLLHNKFILLIGDSVQRSIYKDLVVLWHENRFMKEGELRAKGEKSFLGDTLIERSDLTNGVHYKEVREYKSDHILIRFYFATRIYNDYIESVLKKYENDSEYTPDVVLLNSCLWDITRYGKQGWSKYQENIEKFCTRLDNIVPADTCIIWRTTLPVSQQARGGFLSSDSLGNTKALVVDVLLANYLAYAVVVRHKYDVIDMHFMFTQQQQRRARDGVHWNMFAHRRMTNIVLSHVSQAWGLGLPDHPVQDNKNYDFDRQDLSLNTTDVLKCAYPAAPTPSYHRREMEERYGGPVRTSDEMFQYYNNFYQVPQQSNNIHQTNQENTAPFMFDLRAPPRRVEVYNDYWTSDAPLASQNRTALPVLHRGYKEFCGNTRKPEFGSLNAANWNINFNFPAAGPNMKPQWNEPYFAPNSKRGKVQKRRNHGHKPYHNRAHGAK